MAGILLIQPPVQDFYLTKKRTIPYGLACIASALIEKGFSTELFDSLATSRSKPIDLPQEMAYLKDYYGRPDLSPFALFHQFRHFGYSFEHIGKISRESGAYLVGISSLFTAYSREALLTAETVKKFHPDCKVVLGGHHPTALPESVLKNRAVDYVLRGEGEISMPLLAKAVKCGTDPGTIPGIAFRARTGKMIMNDPVWMDNLDQSPRPAMNLVKHSFYQRKKRGATVIVASRGCPMKCSYCSVGSSSIKYRRKSIDAVIEEIQAAVTEYNVGFIDFEDENLSLSKEWLMELLHEIIKQFGIFDLELRAMNGLFPPSLDEELICLMKKAGFKTLNLSLGSTSKEQLRRFNRPDVVDSFNRAVALAKQQGLDVVAYIIAGAPGQKAEDSLEDLLYLAEKKVLAGVSIFYPAPGSEDYKLSGQLGILPEHFSLMRSSVLPVSHTTTRKEAITLLRLGRILNFMKSLTDRNRAIPEKQIYNDGVKDIKNNRQEAGLKLLQWFMHDGLIRGITPDGDVYTHKASKRLSNQFLKHIQTVRAFES